MKTRLAILAVAGLVGCAQPAVRPQKDMSAFNAAAPRSILVAPATNHSLDVDAATFLLSTLTMPLAEKGYYVFPVHTAKMVLEQEGFYEGERIHQQPPETLARMFGADAVLFVSIKRWDAQYVLLSTTVTVELDYRMVAKDGTEIWANSQRVQFQPQNSNSGGALGMLVSAVVNATMARARPNYMPLARQANARAFYGQDGLPPGPYLVIAPQAP